MNFVAIDFETANRSPSSACEIGLVIVEDGRIVDTYRKLIRPTPNYFEIGNIRVHKIRPEDVINEPTFDELYDEIIPLLADKHVVAHNASFDIGVLLASLKQYDLPEPSLTYSCTVQLARRVWPEAPRYGLGIISSYLGIELQHHQALSDANACAQLMLQAQQVLGVTHVDELLREVNLRARSIVDYGSSTSRKPTGHNNWEKQPEQQRLKPRTQAFNWPTYPSIKNIKFEAGKEDPKHPIFGKRFVFTGELTCLSREEAQRQVLELGGKCTASVTNATDYLVQGVPTWKQVTGKVKKALALQDAGKAIKLIDEDTFLSFLKR